MSATVPPRRPSPGHHHYQSPCPLPPAANRHACPRRRRVRALARVARCATRARLASRGASSARAAAAAASLRRRTRSSSATRPPLRRGAAAARAARVAGAREPPAPAAHTRLLRLRRGDERRRRARRAAPRARRAWAVPDYLAHASGGVRSPTTPAGRAARAGGWQELQWNFAGRSAWTRRKPGRTSPPTARPGGQRRDGGGARHRRRLRQPRPVPPLAGLRPLPVRPGLRLRRPEPLPERPQRPRHVRGGDDRRGHQQPATASPASPTARS